MPAIFFALFLLPLTTFAASPGQDFEADRPSYLGAMKIDLAPESEEKAEKPKYEFKYVTRQEITLKGIMLKGDANDGDAMVALPDEILLPAETVFTMEDRTNDGQGNRFVKINIQTGDELNSVLSYWIDETQLVESLYEVKGGDELSLDSVDVRDARFAYGATYQVAGPNPFMMPVRSARKSSPPGWRIHPIKKIRKFHRGWDLAAPGGTPVMASLDGVVQSAGWGGGYGNLIVLKHGKLSSRYAHLSKILVRSGQRVRQGEVIGKVGTTGVSTGNHLHFEQIAADGSIISAHPQPFRENGAPPQPTVQVAAKDKAPVVAKPVVVAKPAAAPVAKPVVATAKPEVTKPAVAKPTVKPAAKKAPVKKKRKLRRRAAPQQEFNIFNIKW